MEIEQGMNSSDIAELLEKNEVIVGTEPLIDYLAEHDLSQTIQLGSYEVDSTMSIEEIAHLITR
ncbi:endolytic transglycosylase MltG [Allobacillus sp. SKP2-8]|uniref:Endolytic transglycosylase MltG n=1 Tax=Allobacillus halotolerans TaxID=570278 RepID=A0ABS6GKL4_9BACI|nr:endolytic transglycosylase MltG [Allobacillus halotolerans]TSJ69473.1 endolytic transglycosylase MltG [Allobacillus sp. SKP2-8]